MLTLALSTITVNGRPVDVTQHRRQTESSSRGARSAGVIGGTAASGRNHRRHRGRRQGSGDRRRLGSRGRDRRGSAHQRTEGQDSLGNQTDVPLAEPHAAMRVAAALIAIGLTLAGQSVFAAHADVVEGNPASPVKVVIYEDLQCGDCARFQSAAGTENPAQVRVEGRVYPSRFSARETRLGAAGRRCGALGLANRITNLGIAIRRELLAEQDSITSQNLKQWLVVFASRNHLDQKGILDSLTDPTARRSGRSGPAGRCGAWRFEDAYRLRGRAGFRRDDHLRRPGARDSTKLWRNEQRDQ